MNRFGVEVSVVSNLNGAFYKNTQSANEELYDELKSDKRFGDRFIPFAVINPIYAGWKEDLETCVTKMGMKGLRVYPQYHDYGITEPSFIELVKMARDHGLPVAIDIRMVDSRQRSWMDIPVFEPKEVKYDIITKEWALKNIVPIVKEVPDAKYIIVNLATSINLDDKEISSPFVIAQKSNQKYMYNIEFKLIDGKESKRITLYMYKRQIELVHVRKT